MLDLVSLSHFTINVKKKKKQKHQMKNGLKTIISEDLFEKAKYLASLLASTDKAFKYFPFSLIVLD